MKCHNFLCICQSNEEETGCEGYNSDITISDCVKRKMIKIILAIPAIFTILSIIYIMVIRPLCNKR